MIDLERISILFKDVESLTAKVDQLTKEINGLKIDEQQYVPMNRSISPSIAPKIAFDSNGLVLKGMPLDPSDIPDIQISQVSGLKNILDNIADPADLKKLSADIKNMIVKRSNNPSKSGTKINYDENGFVVSSSDLSVDDIPTLPMSKIDGLSDLIDIIKSISDINSASHGSVTESHITKSGTFTKVSIDQNGRVVNGERITSNDLPIDFVNRINQMESMILNAAPVDVIDKMNKSLLKKVDANPNPIIPGSYVKVSVDSKGLVTGSGDLTVSDLPELTIDDITGLKKELNQTAKYTDIADLNDAISKITSNLHTIGDITQLKTSVKLKADADQVGRIEKELASVKEIVTTMQEMIPVEFILTELKTIAEKISTIEGKIAVLENKIS